MITRPPIVAGMFYPSNPVNCRQHAAELFAAAAWALDGPDGLMARLPDRIVGGIVPHAGWAFSGEPAARTLEAIARTRTVDTFIVFGAAHRLAGPTACLFDRGRWQTPLGDVEVDEQLASRIAEASDLVAVRPAAHGDEHSIEVQLPLIRHRFFAARIVPILMPLAEQAEQVGLAVGRIIASTDAQVVVLGSTDLTHYGPSYGMIDHGVGPKAMDWAKRVNDAGVIEAVARLDAAGAVSDARARQSACGGGAVAATLAAARYLGATGGVVLEHVTSHEIMRDRMRRESDDSVGYLSAVLG